MANPSSGQQVTTGGVTDTQLGARIGAITDAEAAGDGTLIAIAKRQRTILGSIAALLAGTIIVSGTVSVSGTSAQNLTQVAGAAVSLGSKTSTNSVPVVVASDQGAVTTTISGTPTVAFSAGSQVSIGSATNKTNVLKTGSLTTTAVTADQVVLTYTVTSGKTFYLEYISLQSRLTVVAAAASILGAASVETPSGTKVITHTFINPTTSAVGDGLLYSFAEPIPIAAAVVVRCVTTPAATTSMLWICNFGGYEK